MFGFLGTMPLSSTWGWYPSRAQSLFFSGYGYGSGYGFGGSPCGLGFSYSSGFGFGYPFGGYPIGIPSGPPLVRPRPTPVTPPGVERPLKHGRPPQIDVVHKASPPPAPKFHSSPPPPPPSHSSSGKKSANELTQRTRAPPTPQPAVPGLLVA